MMKGVLFDKVRKMGLQMANISRRKSASSQETWFQKHYRSPSEILAKQWKDLRKFDHALTKKEKGKWGLQRFLAAHHFLFTYPKSSHLQASAVSICERECRGKPLWRWFENMASLKEKKIVWPEEHFKNPETAINIITVDGVDFKTWERKHPKVPRNRKLRSHKMNHAAVKYVLVISVFESKLVLIDGPHRGGKHDMEIFCKKLKKKIPHRGFSSSEVDEWMMSTPNNHDSKALSKFKIRAICCHETFNGRIRHFDDKKQKLAMEAVCVTVQYQMDNSYPLFSF
jgi:hypothetical protein